MVTINQGAVSCGREAPSPPARESPSCPEELALGKGLEEDQQLHAASMFHKFVPAFQN